MTRLPFHYIPLHSSPGGRRLGRTSGSLSVTTDVAARLVRLPIWPGLEGDELDHVIDATCACVKEIVSGSSPSTPVRLT